MGVETWEPSRCPVKSCAFDDEVFITETKFLIPITLSIGIYLTNLSDSIVDPLAYVIMVTPLAVDPIPFRHQAYFVAANGRIVRSLGCVFTDKGVCPPPANF